MSDIRQVGNGQPSLKDVKAIRVDGSERGVADLADVSVQGFAQSGELAADDLKLRASEFRAEQSPNVVSVNKLSKREELVAWSGSHDRVQLHSRVDEASPHQFGPLLHFEEPFLHSLHLVRQARDVRYTEEPRGEDFDDFELIGEELGANAGLHLVDADPREPHWDDLERDHRDISILFGLPILNLNPDNGGAGPCTRGELCALAFPADAKRIANLPWMHEDLAGLGLDRVNDVATERDLDDPSECVGTTNLTNRGFGIRELARSISMIWDAMSNEMERRIISTWWLPLLDCSDACSVREGSRVVGRKTVSKKILVHMPRDVVFLVRGRETMTDPEAAAESLEPYRKYLKVLAELHLDRKLRGKLDASDIVQQTMLRAYPAFSEVREPTSEVLVAWLRRILARTLADAVKHYDRDKRDVALERSVEAALDRSASGFAVWLAADQTSPSGRAERNEELLRMVEALAELPDLMREVVVLKHCQGWTLPRIAERVGKSVPSVASLLRRGLEELRTRLKLKE